ncbi:MAG: glycosyltransferase [Gammaproteobacteria bacterium]|nr:glycosyltransferase [Gammaproteobacteria bacterium]
MKLLIQIPCYNEEQHLAETFADLPREIPGIDQIEVLIVNDGSTDKTVAVAKEIGVHHILSFTTNRGLSAAFMSGIDTCYRLGADIVVNFDGDNQYKGEDICRLIRPLLESRADIVIGDRQTNTIQSFSPMKKRLQYWGSKLVRGVSGMDVTDSTSGFRALNRKAISKLFVHNNFTYTLETIIQAGNAGLSIENIKIETNSSKRKSRLFGSISEYLRRNGLVIFRSYAMYSPMKVFGSLAALFFASGVILCLRFLFYFISNPQVSSHIQSLQIGTGLVIISFVIALLALLADLSATNRRLMEDVLGRVRNIESVIEQESVSRSVLELESTTAKSWDSDKAIDQRQ